MQTPFLAKDLDPKSSTQISQRPASTNPRAPSTRSKKPMRTPSIRQSILTRSACWTGVLMQGRRMETQPSGEMLGPFARYIADGRPLFSSFCFSFFGTFLFVIYRISVYQSAAALMLQFQISFFDVFISNHRFLVLYTRRVFTSSSS